ncbi:fimbrial protein [Phocaeicola salanitronis]|uniref:fimbrial protein n=1 Tax=Phocaeicola salanitronis TaxID=376805 RepID=UPI00320ACEB7
MKTTSLHIAFAALLSLLLLASCSRNDEVSVAEGEEGKVYVTLTLSINGEEVGSRATWNSEQDTDEEGVGWENKIDDLQILIYDDADEYVGTVEDLFASNSQYVGTLSGTNWQSGTYKFVVLANFTASNTKLADLAAITYNQNAEYIPMWGVLKSYFNFAAGERTDIGSIDLLRAMAKVEVNFAESFPSDYEIGAITISPYNTQGYCLPAGYESVETTGALDREEAGTAYSFNPLAASASTSSLTFTEENGKYYIYLPEYENTETNAAKIKVTVNGETYELEFKDYENGTPTGAPYDIVRNHIYRYTITGVNDGKLIIKYKAMPWELVTSEIGYAPQPISTNSNPFAGLTGKWEETAIAKGDYYILLPRNSYNEDDRNTTYQLLSYLYENPDKGDDDARYCILTKPTYVDDDHKILKTGSAGARYFFLLTGPEGATWKAHLTNEEDFYFSTSTVSDFNHSAEYGNDNGGKVNMVSHGIARAKPYIIQINVRHSWTGVSEDAEGIAVDESGSVTGEYPWYLDEEYLYEEDGDTKSHVDDISDEKDSWWDSDKRSAFWAKYDNEDNSPLKNAFSYFTEWGADMDEKKDLSLISTDFYITVTLADGAEYNLKINPPYEYLDASNKTDTRYKDNRRFAGTDERIRIRHVPAQYMWGYDDLASPELNQHQEDAGLTETYWWQKNEYWK